MARLASVMKQGFHPAPPEAIAGILRHLKIPDPPPDPKKGEDINILDPCAGEGKAPVQLADQSFFRRSKAAPSLRQARFRRLCARVLLSWTKPTGAYSLTLMPVPCGSSAKATTARRAEPS
jgi:hypothetical protein